MSAATFAGQAHCRGAVYRWTEFGTREVLSRSARRTLRATWARCSRGSVRRPPWDLPIQMRATQQPSRRSERWWNFARWG